METEGRRDPTNAQGLNPHPHTASVQKRWLRETHDKAKKKWAARANHGRNGTSRQDTPRREEGGEGRAGVAAGGLDKGAPIDRTKYFPVQGEFVWGALWGRKRRRTRVHSRLANNSGQPATAGYVGGDKGGGSTSCKQKTSYDLGQPTMGSEGEGVIKLRWGRESEKESWMSTG